MGDGGYGLGKQWSVRAWMRRPENLFWLPGFDFRHWLNLEEVQRLFLEPILDPLIKSHVTNLRD